jgi:hypothetical protein
MSESRRQKKLEKKRQKRKEKLKEKLIRQQAPPSEYPLEHALINDDWKDTRSARIGIVRRHPESGLLISEFLVDLDGFGLRDCFAPRRTTPEALQEYLRREKRVRAEPDLCAALVHGAVAWANKFRFPLPKDTHKALDMLPEAGECPVAFGRDGEPFLRGDEADIRARVRQSGHQLEDFECELFPAPSKEKKLHFVTEEYLRDGDRNDPLVRLERLAALADRYEHTGELPKAEELHRPMEELAQQANRLADFLRYLAAFNVRQERMEQVLKIHERIVEATEEPRAKALARLDLADFNRYLGDALGADEVYQRVIQDHPDLVEARLRYAAFLCEAARRDEGKEAYRALIADLKNRPEAKDLLGRAYQQLYTTLAAEGASADAKALYKEAKREQGIRLH